MDMTTFNKPRGRMGKTLKFLEDLKKENKTTFTPAEFRQELELRISADWRQTAKDYLKLMDEHGLVVQDPATKMLTIVEKQC